MISDIDGTITRSDVLGHLMPFVGKDWSHKGVCEFFTNLIKNKYLLIYLTARNFGQAKKTLRYLESVKQGDYILPEGPLILSPQSLYQSFRTEVIKGKFPRNLYIITIFKQLIQQKYDIRQSSNT